jgi:Fe-S-cluster containining protein
MRAIGFGAYHSRVVDQLFATMQRAWAQAAARFEAYHLVLPGGASFVCQPEACAAYCCHAYSVSLSEADAERMHRLEGVERLDFLELDEHRQPVELPMAHPYLLARSDGHCKMLGPDLRCGAYGGRPNACRLYPHFIVFWDAEAGRALTNPSAPCAEAFQASLAGRTEGLVPLLLGHSECPGFTGPPLGRDAWFGIFRETYQLQYAEV